MATTKQLETWLREAWRLHGAGWIDAHGELDLEEADDFPVDDVARHFLWESVRDFVEGVDVEPALLLHQRVGNLEANVSALNLSIHCVARLQVQLDEVRGDQAFGRERVKALIRDVIMEGLEGRV